MAATTMKMTRAERRMTRTRPRTDQRRHLRREQGASRWWTSLAERQLLLLHPPPIRLQHRFQRRPDRLLHRHLHRSLRPHLRRPRRRSRRGCRDRLGQ